MKWSLPFVIALIAFGFCALKQNALGQSRTPSRVLYEKARQDFFTLKSSNSRQKYRHNWLKVIASFKRVNSQYPTSQEAPMAVYTAAELWNDLHTISLLASDLEQALTAYERVVYHYSQSSLADDALWARAEIFSRKLHDEAQTASTLRTLLKLYSKGDMAPRARERLKQFSHVPESVSTVNAKPKDELEKTIGELVGRSDKQGTVARVTDIKHWSNPVYTRVAIYLSAPVQARSGEVAAQPNVTKPARIYVDLKKAKLGKSVSTILRVQDEILQQIRTAQYNEETVRVVLDLKTDVKQRMMTMENPFRLVIDAYAHGVEPKKSNSNVTSPPTVGPKAPADLPPTPQKDRKQERHVVIDPGHGGKDTGAVGTAKVKEKDIVLQVALEVANLIKKNGIAVSMTRYQDHFVALEERTAIANRLEADIFVSIHANSNRSKKVQGIETYYLNVTDDRYALKLAAVENQTSEEQVSDLQIILADLVTKVNTDDSRTLAQRIQKQLVKKTKSQHPATRDLGVKASLFYVLIGARMPAVLTEIGFISNPNEGQFLQQSRYQKEIASAIASAIIQHLQYTPIAL